MLLKLSELGVLYQKIRTYIHRGTAVIPNTSNDEHLSRLYSVTGSVAVTKPTTSNIVVGPMEQSFFSAIQNELTEYYRLIAVLESQVRFITIPFEFKLVIFYIYSRKVHIILEIIQQGLTKYDSIPQINLFDSSIIFVNCLLVC